MSKKRRASETVPGNLMELMESVAGGINDNPPIVHQSGTLTAVVVSGKKDYLGLAVVSQKGSFCGVRSYSGPRLSKKAIISVRSSEGEKGQITIRIIEGEAPIMWDFDLTKEAPAQRKKERRKSGKK